MTVRILVTCSRGWSIWSVDSAGHFRTVVRYTQDGAA